jgi:light-regulated signal transduction histidine kinase (bacteriophytochrome)
LNTIDVPDQARALYVKNTLRALNREKHAEGSLTKRIH